MAMLSKKTIKFLNLIQNIIEEHNNIWKDISVNLRYWKQDKGYNCITLPETTIITIASGLTRKIK